MPGEEPSLQKATILVVDDEAAVRRVLVMRLQLSGYKVICAEDGEEALELFHRESPDLIVLDVMLPKLDGFAVCRRRPSACSSTGHSHTSRGVPAPFRATRSCPRCPPTPTST